MVNTPTFLDYHHKIKIKTGNLYQTQQKKTITKLRFMDAKTSVKQKINIKHVLFLFSNSYKVNRVRNWEALHKLTLIR